MNLRTRIRLAMAVLLNSEVCFHMDSVDRQKLQRRLDDERREIKKPEDRYWMVEPIVAAWVPAEFPHGKNDTRVVIAPVQIPQHGRVTVIRW